MAAPVYRIRVVDESGRTVEIEPGAVRPLSLDDIGNSGAAGTNLFDLEFQATGGEVDGSHRPDNVTLRTSTKFHLPISIFALVRGGWLPPPLVVPPMFLVDRNVIATLRRLRQGVRRQDSAELEWWLGLVSGGKTSFNPLPSAMEGGTQSPPTLDQLIENYERDAAEITASFPEAQIPLFSRQAFEEVYQLVSALGRRSQIEAAFLVEVVPFVVEPVSSRALDGVRDRILEAAVSRGLAPGALALVAVMSCLFGDDVHTIGRGVLKPGRDFGIREGYNAVSDLKLVELLGASMGLPHLGEFSLCTCDRALAQFWCALVPRFERWENPGATVTMALDHRLFPRLDPDRLDEMKKLLMLG